VGGCGESERERGWGNGERENWRFLYPLFSKFVSLFYSFPWYASFKFRVAFFLLSAISKKTVFPPVHVQLLAGQHSILRDIWIMMDILLPLPQLMQLQQVEFLLGIGERPLEMVTLQLNLTVL
jgi:hypothetical protein